LTLTVSDWAEITVAVAEVDSPEAESLDVRIVIFGNATFTVEARFSYGTHSAAVRS
jgi:hypothetical protein